MQTPFNMPLNFNPTNVKLIIFIVQGENNEKNNYPNIVFNTVNIIIIFIFTKGKQFYASAGSYRTRREQ